MAVPVVGDASGFPMRCFNLVLKDGEKLRLCITWFQLPAFIWQRSGPDPGPERLPIEISGVNSALLRDLEIVDTIDWLSKKLSSNLAKSFDAAVKQNLKTIQEQMPPNVSLSAVESSHD
jgi:hypothetical protein